MTKLEKTLLSLAQQHLAEIVRLLEAGEGGKVRVQDDVDYLQSTAALTALLELGHLTDSGMSEDAVREMLDVEADHAVVLSAVTLESDGAYQQARSLTSERSFSNSLSLSKHSLSKRG